MSKKFNVRLCMSTDKTRQFMCGVYYENGFAVATDGRVLAVIRDEYKAEYEKTIRDKNGNEINEQFPNYKRVIPEIKKMVRVSCPALSDMKVAYSMPTEYGVKLERFTFSTKIWKALFNFIDLWSSTEVYVDEKNPENKAVVFKAGDNMIVAMQFKSATYRVLPGAEVCSANAQVKYKQFRCDGLTRHSFLKCTYKQLKDTGVPILTVGNSKLLEGVDWMCMTWGKNGWNVFAYDMSEYIITNGPGANGLHIPDDLVKKYEAETTGIYGDAYKVIIDRFLDEVDTWYKARNVA